MAIENKNLSAFCSCGKAIKPNDYGICQACVYVSEGASEVRGGVE